MKKEILEWYAQKSLEIHKQVELGMVFGLTKHQIEAAMERCYVKIVEEGKQIPDNQIAWYVRNVAKNIDTTTILKEHEAIEDVKDFKLQVVRLNRKICSYGALSARALNKLKAHKKSAKENALKLRREYGERISNLNISFDQKVLDLLKSEEGKRKAQACLYEERIAELNSKAVNAYKIARRDFFISKKKERVTATIIYLLSMLLICQWGVWFI